MPISTNEKGVSTIADRVNVMQTVTKDITVSKTLMPASETSVRLNSIYDNVRSLRIDIKFDNGDIGTTYPNLDEIIAGIQSDYDVDVIAAIIDSFINACHLYGASQAGF